MKKNCDKKIVLKKFLRDIPGINAILIATTEGLPIVSALPYGYNETRVAAMTANLQSLAKYSIDEIMQGEFDYLIVKSLDGYFLIFPVESNMVLAISTTSDVRLGSIILECKRICEKITRGDFDNHFPYPYVFKPPTPPGDLGLAGEPQAKLPIIEKIQEYESYCKHCGAELPEGQSICHVYGKKSI